MSDTLEPLDLISRAEVARLFEVAPSTITRWTNDGLMKRYRKPDGRRDYYSRAEISERLNKSRQTA